MHCTPISASAPRIAWIDLLRPWQDRTDAAVVGPGGAWAGRDLIASAAAVADWLDDRDIPDNSVVAAAISDPVMAMAVGIGVMATGRTFAPLATLRTTASEWRVTIAAMSPSAVIAAPELEGMAHEAIAMIETMAEPTAVLPLGTLRPGEQEFRWGPNPDAVALLLHTSGTSGTPKLVPLTQHVLAVRARLAAATVHLGSGSVFASASPFHHLAGIGMYTNALGCGAAVAPMARFSVEAFTALSTLGVTHAVLVPTMIDDLLASGMITSVPSLQVLQFGTSPMPPTRISALIQALPGVEIVQMYGQTEGSPITYLNYAEHEGAAEDWRLLTSVGRAVPGVQLRIATGTDGQPGELCAKGEHFSLTESDGWLRTRDLGWLDDDGYLFLTGRTGDMIIRGGENVYPMEVENVLTAVPGVLEAAVFGVDDPHWGQTVAAVVVVTDPGRAPSPERLAEACRRVLAPFKVPTNWIVRTEPMPRNPTGKIVRSQLAAMFTHTPESP